MAGPYKELPNNGHNLPMETRTEDDLGSHSPTHHIHSSSSYTEPHEFE